MSLFPFLILRSMASAALAAYGAVVLAHAAALRAAGVTGKAPANAAAITTFVSTITENALWVIGTVAVLAVVVIGGPVFFGHSRGAAFAVKILSGGVVIVAAPGIAA